MPISSAVLLISSTQVFLLVFACAKRKGLPTVVLSLLGGGAFSELFPGGPERYVAQSSPLHLGYISAALGCASP